MGRKGAGQYSWRLLRLHARPYRGDGESSGGPAPARHSASASDDPVGRAGTDEYSGLNKALSPSGERVGRGACPLICETTSEGLSIPLSPALSPEGERG